MKKRFAVLTAAAMLLFVFSGCNSAEGGKEAAPQNDGGITVTEFGGQGNPEELSDKDYFVVTISVNPEVELYVSPETGEVIYVGYCNDDALNLAEGKGLDLVNCEYDKAVEDFVKACADENYLNDGNNDIDIVATAGSGDDVGVPDNYGEKMTDIAHNIDGYVDFEIVVFMPCGACGATGLCSLCHGEKSITCDLCNGVNSAVTCSNCGGTGIVTCSCGGAGCEACEETGKTSCLTCTGIGQILCNRCDGSGYMTCVRCDGDGICTHCHGNKEY